MLGVGREGPRGSASFLCESLSCFAEEWGEEVGGATIKQIKLGALGLGQPTP